MNLSASPFALGYHGMTLRCLNPKCEANCVNSVPLNGGPLSVRTESGMPKSANVLSNAGITVRALVLWMISTIGYRE